MMKSNMIAVILSIIVFLKIEDDIQFNCRDLWETLYVDILLTKHIKLFKQLLYPRFSLNLLQEPTLTSGT